MRDKLFAAMILGLAGCSSPDQLVGDWRSGPETLHFLKDGTFVVEAAADRVASGTWRRLPDDRFVVAFNGTPTTLVGCYALGVIHLKNLGGHVETYRSLHKDGTLGPSASSVSTSSALGSNEDSSDCRP